MLMKLITYCRSSTYLFLLFFLITSCEKTDTGFLKESIQYDRWEQLNATDVVYNQVKYDYAYMDPLSFLPEEHRRLFEEAFNLNIEEFKALGYERALDLLQERGVISNAYGDQLTQSIRSIEQSNTGGGYNIDFDAVFAAIQAESEAMKTNFALSLEERKLGVLQLSLYEGIAKYFSEVYPNGNLDNEGIQFRSCTFWERYWCISQGFFYGVLAGVAVAVGTGAAVVTAPVTAGTTAAIIGAETFIVVGALLGSAVGAIVDCCEPEYECYFIEGVSTRFSSCEPVAEYTAFGFGDQAEELSWNNVNGIPMSVITPVANPRTTITQINSNIAVETRVTTVCDDGTEVATNRAFTLDLFQRSRSISNFYLSGQDQIYPGETYLYTGIGGGVEVNYDIRWFVNGGVVLSTGNRNATIRWNEGIEDGWVQMEVRNRCSGGEFRLFTLNVTGDGPIP